MDNLANYVIEQAEKIEKRLEEVVGLDGLPIEVKLRLTDLFICTGRIVGALGNLTNKEKENVV